jgi:membrane-associated phospholipid phosphatase
MDNVGFPVHGDGLETALFGGSPTLWLQEHVFELWPGPLGWASALVHASWFVAPLLPAAFIALSRPERLGSLYRWWTALFIIALTVFALFPLQPPWMANGDVTRIIAIHLGGHLDDPNPLAAMPSMHVALPLLTALWFYRERWKTPGTVMLAYSALVAFEVVFSGEHYVVDVMGAALVAAGVMLLARVDYGRAFGRISRLAAIPLRPVRRQEMEPSAGALARLYHSQRGQTLIEFAFIAPIIFVFLFAIVDFGIALDRRIVLQHAVREGARMAAVKDDIGQICDHTVAEAQDIIAASDIALSYEDMDDPPDLRATDAGDSVRVSATFTYELPILREMFSVFGVGPLSVEMTPSGTARLERSVSGETVCP